MLYCLATYLRCTIVVYSTCDIIVVPPVGVKDTNDDPIPVAYVNRNHHARVHRQGDVPNVNERDVEVLNDVSMDSLKSNRANSPPPELDVEVEVAHVEPEPKDHKQKEEQEHQPFSAHEIKLYDELCEKYKHNVA